MAATTKRARCSPTSRSASFCRPSSWRRTWPARWSSGPAIASHVATRRPAGRICTRPIGSAARPKRSADFAHEYAEQCARRSATLSGGGPAGAGARAAGKASQARARRRARAHAAGKLPQLMQEAERVGRPRPFCRGDRRDRPGRSRSPSSQASGTGYNGRNCGASERSKRERLRVAADDCQRLTAEMHAALAAENWSAVLTRRRRAAGDRAAARGGRPGATPRVEGVGMDVTQLHAGGVAQRAGVARGGQAAGRGGRRVHAPLRRARARSIPWQEMNIRSERCCGSMPSAAFWCAWTTAIVLGQPSPGESIAVPILADLSRRHAVIRRDAGAYVLEPLQRTLRRRPRDHGPVRAGRQPTDSTRRQRAPALHQAARTQRHGPARRSKAITKRSPRPTPCC